MSDQLSWDRHPCKPEPEQGTAGHSSAQLVTAVTERIEYPIGVLGDIYVDLLCKVAELPVWGEDRLASTTLLAAGGSTANTARFLGSLGGGNVVRLFSAVGNDLFGSYFIEQLRSEGCVTTDGSLVVLPGVPTSVCVVLSGPSDRGFVSCNTSNNVLFPGMFDLETLLAQRHVHVGGLFNMPNMHCRDLLDLLGALHAAGVTLSLDTQFDVSGAWDGKGCLPECLGVMDVFMPNELEAAGVTGAPTPEAALEVLCARMRPGALALVKVGARGVLAGRAGSAERWHVPSAPVSVVDLTGAGDAFNAGFLHAYVRGAPVDACLRAGTAGGALAVQSLGGCERLREWANALHAAESALRM
ncbi:Ribokinase-like protein, partial [Pavlovales sp. CCMP2436]